ncbi:hypothetical protein [Nocardioides sp. Kera G14]|uniref:hypothetical protein n=1 Tax=Nocardioides sp. Kera G14 TaxID=2884264 RepID=UPI001D0FADF5|nr:hypothetical protein [Nocardioides sp. Kera G14]UDY22702.1 hypothetical protein LH076_11555 [Nocardioides sp. Kera G14]
MTADDRLRQAEHQKDYTRLPEGVRLDETIETVDPQSPPDSHAGRNADQHRALRDD